MVFDFSMKYGELWLKFLKFFTEKKHYNRHL